jgi:predicted hydrocarbon binding protein
VCKGKKKEAELKRDEFLRKTVQLGLGAGSLLLLTENNTFAKPGNSESGQTSEPPGKNPGETFKENWVSTLFEKMDEQLDKEKRGKLMQSCGRECARRGAIKLAQSCRGDVKKMVETLAKHLGEEKNYLEGNSVYLEFDKCECPLVQKGPDRLPRTYCECSKGWLSEMFETAAQKPVKVEMLQTVKSGGSSCKFIIRLS